jgi:hypothetical protein
LARYLGQTQAERLAEALRNNPSYNFWEWFNQFGRPWASTPGGVPGAPPGLPNFPQPGSPFPVPPPPIPIPGPPPPQIPPIPPIFLPS